MPAMFHELPTPPPSQPLVDRELTLIEMLDDPIVVRVMQRDGVARADVVTLFAAGRRSWLCRAAAPAHGRVRPFDGADQIVAA